MTRARGFVVRVRCEPGTDRRDLTPGERYLKNVAWSGRPWTRDEALKVAAYEARALARTVNQTPGPEARVMRDPDGDCEGLSYEVLTGGTDDDMSHPNVLAVLVVKEVPFALGGSGPVTHPALEA